MRNNYYKASNKFSIAGVLLAIFATVIIGGAFSPIYLKLIEVIPFIYLNILLTFGYGALIGLVVYFIVKKTKIRNAFVVFIAVLVGTIIFSLFKWSVYCQWDNEGIYKEFYGKGSPDEEYFEDFEYTFGFETGESVSDFMLHPSKLFNHIDFVNEDGRWTFTSSSSSSSSPSNVKGIALTIVWICEFGIILIVAAGIGASQAKKPFIESENNWAEVAPKKYYFANIDLKVFKHTLEMNPKEIFKYPYLCDTRGVNNYTEVILYHSQDFNEGYIELGQTVVSVVKKQRKEQRVNTVKYITVDNYFIDELWTGSFLKKETEQPEKETVPQYEYQEYCAAPMDALSTDFSTDVLNKQAEKEKYESMLSDLEPK